MLGERRVEAVMRRSRLHWKRRRMREKLRLEPLNNGDHCANGTTRDETVVELDRCDMKKLLDGMESQEEGGRSDSADSESGTSKRELIEACDFTERKMLSAKRKIDVVNLVETHITS